ncbi:Protein of unknown function DUF63 [Methanosalsum zhilinae DSM 4017]|uniref:DUF63 family protein n=1 Tax=Methanosalsum zhilinae (strain DSM 4017 / NBRC 107636 / OCM 62 / WeN5) TaxID=679901 RepID=F7XPS4_METZD|nr:DUF63 family protein [Methanosalsum zhilinae]AEH60349.1 Protein of unknown function DUF63 [Methanosalsum zhilinae DSM 4017]
MNSLIDKIIQFLNTYYIDPIRYDTGYNIVNTLTWAIILGISIFGVIKILKRLDIRIDNQFIMALLPFVFAGASFRVVEDAGVVDPPLSYLLITPNIYFLVFIVTLTFLVISKKMEIMGWIRDYRTPFVLAGSVWFILNISTLFFVATVSVPLAPLFVVISATAISYAIYWIFCKSGSVMFCSGINIALIWSHLLDASSTYIGIDFFGYQEKHVVPAYLIEVTNTALVMYPLKIFTIILIIYVLDTYISEKEEAELKNIVKMVIIILGLSPAIRNTLRITFGI